jgi:hypothetical protein
MKILTKGLIVFLLPLFAFTVAHKFYLSVTNVQYSEKDRALQITTRIFVDDLDRVLKERYGIEPKLGTKDEPKLTEAYLEKYLRTKFVVLVDGRQQGYTYVGREYNNDVVICYLEVPKLDLDKIKTITVQNEVLTDLFEEQQNVLHFKIRDYKKSFVLMRDNNKGMLKL